MAISTSSEPGPYLDDRGTASENGGALEGGLEGVLEIGMMIALLLLLTQHRSKKVKKGKGRVGKRLFKSLGGIKVIKKQGAFTLVKRKGKEQEQEKTRRHKGKGCRDVPSSSKLSSSSSSSVGISVFVLSPSSCMKKWSLNGDVDTWKSSAFVVVL